MTTGRDFVFINPQSWKGDISGNCRNIALELAKHNRVLFVNPPLVRNLPGANKNDADRIEYTELTEAGKHISIKELGNNLWNLFPKSFTESIRWIPNTSIFSFFNKINNKRFAKDIQEGIDKLGFKNVIIFNDTEMFKGFYLKELLNPDLYIYYSKDYMLEVPFWKKHGVIIEPALMAKSDIGVANSTYLRDLYAKHNPNAYYIGQGCNFQVFDVYKNYPTPEDIIPIKKPIVGYVGALTNLRIDMSIITNLAEKLPHWSVVLVGPESDGIRKENYAHLKNIIFLGKKPLDTLSSYINSFEVCINPQLINATTIGNYPLKVDEYLAMGKPVVATKTKGMQFFADYCLLAETPVQYPALVEQAHNSNNETIRQQRISFARSHTWENVSIAIYDAIEKTLAKRRN